MHTYTITSGQWTDPSGKLLGIGYSGSPDARNDASKCNVPDQGPIPPGKYTILFPRNTDTHGPYVLPLWPAPDNTMYGRSGFLIHGDSIQAPGTASHGCIILPRNVREAIWGSGDRELTTTV